jgi:hypothetical protein
MMSKTFFRGAIIAFVVSTFMIGEVRSQDEQDLVEYLRAGQSDASKLIGAYVGPAVEGLSYGMNGGWFQTAKAHKTFGCDLNISLNAVFIPSSRNHFDPNSLGLQVAQIVPDGGKAPSIVGPKETPQYDLDDDGDADFEGPEGLDFKGNFKVSGVVAPTVTLGVGIYKGTDIKIRYMPEVEAGKTKIKLIGFGVVHDIKQHIPGIKLLPFDLSILGAFTKVDGTSGLDGTFASKPGDTSPQKIDYTMNAWLIQALISKKISVVTFYGGIGYNTINTKANITGSYVVPELGGQALENPFNETFKNNSLRVTAGVRLKFGPFYIFGDYTLQEFSGVSAGLGFSFLER